MECSCNIDSGFDGVYSDCVISKIVKARKRHKCNECYKTINKGEEYEVTSGIWNGTPHRYKTCLDCKSIRDVFFNNGYTFTEVWWDFKDGFDPGSVSEICLANLTPEARSRVCTLIENYWEYQEDE